jgi:hypothetical protein
VMRRISRCFERSKNSPRPRWMPTKTTRFTRRPSARFGTEARRRDGWVVAEGVLAREGDGCFGSCFRNTE